jgi:hypothetical protein
LTEADDAAEFNEEKSNDRDKEVKVIALLENHDQINKKSTDLC